MYEDLIKKYWTLEGIVTEYKKRCEQVPDRFRNLHLLDDFYVRSQLARRDFRLYKNGGPYPIGIVDFTNITLECGLRNIERLSREHIPSVIIYPDNIPSLYIPFGSQYDYFAYTYTPDINTCQQYSDKVFVKETSKKRKKWGNDNIPVRNVKQAKPNKLLGGLVKNL